MPEENFWTLGCKGRLTEADTQTIWLGATPSRLTSAHLHHPYFLQAGCPSCRPTNSVKTLKAKVSKLSPPHHHTTTTVLRPFFWDHPSEPVPKENFWTLWRKWRLTEADTPTIRLSATPSWLSSAHLHHSPHFLQAGCPSGHPTNRVKALKAKISKLSKWN